MEINYCTECRSRVTSLDLKNGDGVEADNRVLCRRCARKEGLLLTIEKNEGAEREYRVYSEPILTTVKTRRAAAAPQPAVQSFSRRTALALGGIGLVVIVILGIIVLSGEHSMTDGDRAAGPGPEAVPDEGLRGEHVPESGPEPGSAPEKSRIPDPAPRAPVPSPLAPLESQKDIPFVVSPASIPDPPSTAEGTDGWISLAWGNSLQQAGWKHQTDRVYGQDFSLVEGIIASAGLKQARVYKDIAFREGELHFDVKYENGASWTLQLLEEPYSGNALTLEFNRNGIGHHSIRLRITGKAVELHDNGKAAGPGLRIARYLKRPIRGQLRARLEILPGVKVAISDFRYRPLGFISSPDKAIDLLAGISLAESGWRHKEDEDFAGVFHLSNGMLAKPVGKKGRILKDISIRESLELKLDYEMTGNLGLIRLQNTQGFQSEIGLPQLQAGRHILVVHLDAKGISAACDGRRLAVPEDDLPRPLQGNHQLILHADAETALTVHSLSMHSPAPAPASRFLLSWVSLLQGGDLDAVGWEHDLKHGEYKPLFKLVKGQLIKGITGEGAAVQTKVPMTRGELRFTMDGNSEYLQLTLYGVPGVKGNHLRFTATRGLAGRHEVHIALGGDQTRIKVDGQEAKTVSGLKVVNPLFQEPGEGFILNIMAAAKTKVRIWDLKYRSME